MKKYQVTVKRWQPFDLTMVVEASSKNAACIIAKEQAKTYSAYVASDLDDTSDPKVSILSVRDL